MAGPEWKTPHPRGNGSSQESPERGQCVQQFGHDDQGGTSGFTCQREEAAACLWEEMSRPQAQPGQKAMKEDLIGIRTWQPEEKITIRFLSCVSYSGYQSDTNPIPSSLVSVGTLGTLEYNI